MSVIILGSDGNFLGETNENGKVRHLIKDKQAKVVKRDPFTIKVSNESCLATISIDNKKESENMEKELELFDVIIANLKLVYPKLEEKDKIELKNYFDMYMYYLAKNNIDTFSMMDFGEFLANETNLDIFSFFISLREDVMSKVKFDVNSYQHIKAPKLAKSKLDIWNCIPIGAVVENEKYKKPIGWYLNGQERNNKIYPTIPCTSLLLAGGPGTGVNTVVSNVINHTIKHSDKFQTVLVDPDQLLFNSFKDNKKIVNIHKLEYIVKAVQTIQLIMMSRFRLMQEQSINNIYKCKKDFIVNYYNFNGSIYQFDDIIKLVADFPLMMTAEEVYNKIYNNSEIDFDSLDKSNCQKVQDIYKPKSIMLVINNIDRIMQSDDINLVQSFKEAIGSIARLGRAAGINILFVSQKPTQQVVSSDLQNLINEVIYLGNISPDTSYFVFEKDISDKVNPLILGRGFLQSGNDLVEIQIYD